MEFNYYYGSQADQFSFIRIPRVMLTEKTFSSLSLHAKVLYGVLLDRMTLSRKNGWFDEENRVYIIYQIGEIQEDLGFTKKKAMDLLAELQDFGLLERKRRGHGLPNILYVKNFMTEAENREITKDVVQDSRGYENSTFGQEHDDPRSAKPDTSETEEADSRSNRDETSGSDSSDSRSVESDAAEQEQCYSRNAETCASAPKPADSRSAETCASAPKPADSRSAENCTSAPKPTNSRSAVFGTPEVPKSALLEVPKSAPLKSYTDKNYTYRDMFSSNLITSFSVDEMRSDENPVSEEEAYEQVIRENIRYDDLQAAHPEDRKLIDGIAALILETVLAQGDSIVIASNRFPASVVKSRFLKLNYSHIEYVLSCLRKNSTKVTNIRKYLLAVLFNAPSTMDGYYRAEVNHDMYSA